MAALPRAWTLWVEDGAGAERCSLGPVADGFRLEGILVRSAGRVPVEARYAVTADDAWRTRRVEVEVDAAGRRSATVLTVDEAGRWRIAGREEPGLDGCLDVDLPFTPATKTLAINRLALAEGQAGELDVAWVRFPDLAVEAVRRRYERLSADRYRVSAGTVAAELAVDGNGLVLEYEGAWRAVGRVAG